MTTTLNDINIETLVSIIIPIYNLGEYKKLSIKCINSVINQSYTNWELIVIDDASTDGTYDYVKNHLNNIKNNKIKIFRNEKNEGCYVSFNKGVKLSSGNYITRLDSDDFFHPDKLKIQVNILKNNKNILIVRSAIKRENKILYNNEISALYKKKIFNIVGYFDSVRFGADSEFRDRCLIKFGSNKIVITKIPLYFSVIRKNSLISSKETGSILFSKIGGEKRKRYVEKYMKWHKKTNKLFIPFPLIKRVF